MLGKDTNDKMNAFFERWKNETKRSVVRDACKCEVERLKKEFSTTTVRTYLTTYRKHAKVHNSLMLKHLKIGYRKQKSIKDKYLTKIRKTLNKSLPIDNYQLMIVHALGLLSSPKPTEIASGLCFLTGRRSTEIMKTAKFTLVGNSNQQLYFKGQLKKGGDWPKYKIYCLGNSAHICKNALKVLREKVDTTELTEEQTKKRYAGSVNNYAFRSFNKFIGDCTSHDLRKAYGIICIQEFKPIDQKPNGFLPQILGHSKDDTTTCNSYQKYYINS